MNFEWPASFSKGSETFKLCHNGDAVWLSELP